MINMLQRNEGNRCKLPSAIRDFQMVLVVPPEAPWAFKDYDPVRIADDIQKTHANLATIFAKPDFGFAHYNSSMIPKNPALGKHDFLAEVSQELHKRGLPVIALIAWWDNYIMQLHPEWAQRTVDGKMITWPGWAAEFFKDEESWDVAVPCPNSPHQEYILSIIREVVSNYEVEGVFFDVYRFFNLCYCKYCRRSYKKDTGCEIPEKSDWGDPAFKKFIEWRYRVLTRFLETARATVKSIRPECYFIPHTATGTHYLTGIWTEDWDRLSYALFSEFTEYVGNYVTGLEFDENAKFLAARADGKPTLVYFPHNHGYFYNPMPKKELELKAKSVVANNCGISPYVLTYPTTNFHPDALNSMADVYSKIEKIEEYLTDVDTVKYTAIYYSQRCQDLYAKGGPTYWFSVRGFFKALVEEHIPADLIVDSHLKAETLAKYDSLILPDAACLEDTQVEEIRHFMENGGGLVATYKTSLCDEWAEMRDDFSLRDVFHASFESAPFRDQGYLCVKESHPIVSEISCDQFVYFQGGYLRVKPVGQYESPAMFISPLSARGLPIYPGEPSAYPAILTSQYGKGKVVYMPGKLDYSYFSFGHPDLRRILVNSVKWASGNEPPLRTDMPKTIRTSMYYQPTEKRYLVHFVNRSVNQRVTSGYLFGRTQATSAVMDIVPVQDIQVSVQLCEGTVEDVFLASSKETLKHEIAEGWVQFTVPKIDIHDIAVIQLA